VLLDGLSVSKDLLRARQMVGMVFQNADTQIVGETVHSDIAFGPENLGLNRVEIEARVERVLEIVGLQGLRDQKPHLLSGGEKRRLAIAGVLAMNPEILVFDEPFSNLDYPGALQLLNQIIHLHECGHSIIIVTHELEKIIAHVDRLVLMQNGSIVRVGEPAALMGEVEVFGVREPCASKYGKGLQSWLT
ncbi:MAG: ABC transporter ATP-binding protein, partial [SAR324 cluster bacterium]|nr:ABC transporter ATP-binding protein [SAR324 cluster bacterium]